MQKGSSRPRWKRGGVPINDETKEAIKSKKRAHKQWMMAKRQEESESRRAVYKKATNEVKKLLRKARKMFEKGIAFEAKRNP